MKAFRQPQRTILLAHGSRDPVWLETFRNLTAPALTGSADARLAFMELCPPSLEDSIRSATDDGITSIRVLPLFLARGRHLRQDIPKLIEQLQVRFAVEIELLPPIGEHPTLAQALEEIILETLESRHESG